MPAGGENESAKLSDKEGFTQIFLSYARGGDEPFVGRLHGDLTKAGFTVWFDRVSMPSRSLTFHQEIRDAIAARERLILVVGPKTITSDYVTQGWQFAYYAANKCVNPIVRLDGRDSQGNIRVPLSVIFGSLRTERMQFSSAWERRHRRTKCD